MHLYKLLIVVLLSVSVVYAQDLHVENLKVDHLSNTDLQMVNGYSAVGNPSTSVQRAYIANERPFFGWEVVSGRSGTAQRAYRIIVSAHRDSISKGIGDIWDSGRVLSNQSLNVVYGGRKLDPDQAYIWRVMVWDDQENPSVWSTSSTFFTAKEQLSGYVTSVYPLQKTDEYPRKVTKVDDVWRIDFGKAAFGQIRLSLTSKKDKDTAVVRVGEAIRQDGSINPKPGGNIRYAEYSIPLRQGRHTYAIAWRPDRLNTSKNAIKMPEYIGEVLPFRYAELERYEENILENTDVVRASVHYPFDDFASHFESSDTVLNQIWELCKYSIKATSFAGIYVDGDRERIPYEADAYINQLGHYAVDKEYSMARRSHEYLLHHATWPTEWILQSVLMAYNDYMYTGDIRSADHNYDVLKAKLLIPLREANALISTKTGKQTRELMTSIHFGGDTLRDIVDWPHTGGFGMVGNGEIDGFVFTRFNTVANAFHYKALKDMALLADVLGKKEDKALFSSLASETYDAFQRLLWDGKQKVYKDGVNTDHSSLHSNMMSMAFGLVPEKRQKDVLAFIRSRGMACSVYGSQFLMDAVYDAGDADYGLSLLTSQSDRSWYNMIRAGSTVTMEAWDNKYKPNQDWNHAWGAVPANVIPRKLMGVEPLEPGWSSFRIRPQIGTLEKAEIRVPTIRGTVEVSCRQDDGSYHLDFTVPVSTHADIELPIRIGKSKPKVILDGQIIAVKVENGFIRIPQVHSGKHTVKVVYK